jgi:hypothetical protein
MSAKDSPHREDDCSNHPGLEFLKMLHTIEPLPDATHKAALNAAVAIDVTVIAAIWCVSSIIVNPIGDFPLADDWVYTLAVRGFLTTGDFRPGHSGAPLLSNVLWGSLFCLPMGVNFIALRLSTLVASLVGIIGCYILGRDAHHSRWLSLLVASILAFNPVYFSVSHTFNTDALCIALMIWASVFFSRSLKSNSRYQTFIGAALALAATFSRELALCIPLAYAVILFLSEEVTPRRAASALTPFMFSVGAFLAFRYWLAMTGRVPTILDVTTNDILDTLTTASYLIKVLFANALVILVYLGLFLSPILLVSTTELFRSGALIRVFRTHARGATVLVSAGMLTMAVGAAIRMRYGVDAYSVDPYVTSHNTVTLFGDTLRMPMSDDFLGKAGVGPLTLRDTWLLNLDHFTRLPIGFWIIVTILGFVGAASLIAALSIHALTLLTQRLPRGGQVVDSERTGAFLVLSAVIYLTPLLVVPSLHDRYLIPSIPLFAAGIVSLSRGLLGESLGSTRSVRLIALSLVTVFSIFSVSGTHDYLGWNRIRWEALRDLMRTNHVGPEDIDGGVEFNGLYLYDPDYHRDPFDLVNPGRSWWWVHRDTYVIAFGTMSGYTVFREYRYRRWLPPKIQDVLVLRKE